MVVSKPSLTAVLVVALAAVSAAASEPWFAEQRLELQRGGPVALEDLDGNGLPDLVVASVQGLEVRLARGEGLFDASRLVAVGADDIAVADLDADGVPDLVSVDLAADTLSVSLGIGGAFFAAPTSSTVVDRPSRVRVADLDLDGALDVVVGSLGTTEGELSILLGVGDGALVAAGGLAFGADLPLFELADMDGDGAPDLVTSEDPGVAVRLGDGAGAFGAPVGVQTACGLVTGLFVADLDGDGVTDVVERSSCDETLVLLGNGDGTLAGAAITPTTQELLALADVDADGVIDLVSSDGTGGTPDDELQVALGAGDGTFGAPLSGAGSDAFERVALADLDGDGTLDLVNVVDGGLNASHAILLGGLGDGRFETNVGAATPSEWPVDLAAADFDGDGALDVATVGERFDELAVLLGVGGGTLGTGVAQPTGAGPTAIAAADLDGDGALDLAIAASDDGALLLHDGAGDGTFGAGDVVASVSSPRDVEAADLDGDGALDLVSANAGSADVGTSLGVGDGTFGPVTGHATGSAPFAVAIGDVDLDGALDLAAALPALDAVAVLLGAGDGAFGPASTLSVGDQPMDVAIADLDVDGAPDLTVVDFASGDVVVRRGAGDGTFAPPNASTTNERPRRVLVADLDADMFPDVVAVNDLSADGTLTVMRGLGGATFSQAVRYRANSQPRAAVAGDFDGDGRLDVAVANRADDTVSILAGREQPWGDVGGGAPGALASGPTLVGAGTLAPSSTGGLGLAQAPAGAPLTLVVGLLQLDLPFKGGVLVPSPDVLLPGLSTNAAGATVLPFTWPAGIPSGAELFFQAWVSDAGAAQGLAGTNGLRAVAP